MQTRRIKITCDTTSMMPIYDLEAFQGGLKTITEAEFEKLKSAILKYGFSFPVFVWRKSILDGHQRVQAVKRLIDDGYELEGGMLPVALIEAKDRKEAAEKLLLINSRYATIEQDGFDWFVQDFDIDVVDMSGLLEIPEIDFGIEDDEEFEGNTDPDDVPEVEETPVTKMGDIWLLGDHRLCCGDSTKIEDVDRLMDGQKADMVFTDPPYNVAENSSDSIVSTSNSPKMKELIKTDWDKNFNFSGVKPSIQNSISKNCTIYICSSHHLINQIWEWFKDICDFYSYCIWYKSNPMPSLSKRHWTWSNEMIAYGTIGKHTFNFPDGHHALSVWDIKKENGKTIHPTEKPVNVPKHAILHSSKENDLILDLFVGSGTTIIAAEQTGRKCYAMEISPQYVQVAIKRWQDFTGEDAVLERTGETFEMIKNTVTP